jgi:hypothetical protein
MQITKKSILTGKKHTMEIKITPEELKRVENRRELGLKIQNIVPFLSPDEREFLINGITKKESDFYFGKCEDYDDERHVDENPR